MIIWTLILAVAVVLAAVVVVDARTGGLTAAEEAQR